MVMMVVVVVVVVVFLFFLIEIIIIIVVVVVVVIIVVVIFVPFFHCLHFVLPDILVAAKPREEYWRCVRRINNTNKQMNNNWLQQIFVLQKFSLAD